jgi:hypothetical protein
MPDYGLKTAVSKIDALEALFEAHKQTIETLLNDVASLTTKLANVTEG